MVVIINLYFLLCVQEMSGNKRKRKDNPTSLGELDPVALINHRNQSVDIQQPGSAPPALQSVTFWPATFQPTTLQPPAYQPTTLQPPAYQPTTLQPYAQEFGYTPPALQSAAFRPYALGPMFKSNTALLDMLKTFGPPRQLQQQQQQH
jgi:hypothetical protein